MLGLSCWLSRSTLSDRAILYFLLLVVLVACLAMIRSLRDYCSTPARAVLIITDRSSSTPNVPAFSKAADNLPLLGSARVLMRSRNFPVTTHGGWPRSSKDVVGAVYMLLHADAVPCFSSLRSSYNPQELVIAHRSVKR